MDAKLTVEIIIYNVCEQSDLDDDYTFKKAVMDYIEGEGSLPAAIDEFKILKIQKVKYDK